MSQPTFNLAEFLPYILNRLSHRVSRNLAHIYRQKYNITISEWRIIAIISQAEKTTAKAVSQNSYMDKVKVSRTIKKLKQKALIDTYTDNKDQRMIWLQLTKQGQSLFDTINPSALEWESEFLHTLDGTQKKTLLSTLGTLNDQLTIMQSDKNGD